MAAPDVSAVVALRNKALELEYAGHRARAFEYRARALAAAQALGAEDCLIMVRLQLDNAQYALMDARTAAADVAHRASLHRAAVEPLFSALATLQRRRAAGTLLPGACRPAEEAFEMQTQVHRARVLRVQNPGVATDAQVASMAPLIGYQSVVTAADISLAVVKRVGHFVLTISPAQLRSAFVAAVHAADAMSQPRMNEEAVVLGIECTFVQNLRAVVEPSFAVRLLPFDELGTHLLLEAWDRLEHSGMLERRYIDVGFRDSIQSANDMNNAAAAASAAPGLRSCALASCGAREAHPQHFKSCAACRIPAYCCKEHQTEDWPSHKAACNLQKAARKAAGVERAGRE